MVFVFLAVQRNFPCALFEKRFFDVETAIGDEAAPARNHFPRLKGIRV